MSVRLRIQKTWFAWRYWPLWCAAACLLALAAWVCPRRQEGLVAVDGGRSWPALENASPREIAWQPPDELTDLLQGSGLPQGAQAEISHPQLADGGATLYFTVRLGGGDADIYRSQLVDGRWQPAEAMLKWNTPWDEQAATVAPGGREVYFASNRPGGQGGFDLYVCRRRTSSWSPPKNAGAPLNTARDEHDPAFSPDALQLYFAGNRLNDGAHFELFSARRAEVGGTWSEPEAVLPAAFAGADQRSPCVAAGGAFLYFASDRPNAGQQRNFNLYRLALADPQARVENLGRGVNTAANETDPSFAADGFAILFASDRAAVEVKSLYRSAAVEVRRVAVWDTSRWQALRAVWGKAFLATLLLVGIAAAVYCSREWLWQTASLGRFLAASLLVHALLVWLMLIVPLSQEIIERVEKIRVSETAAQLADDNLHQSHEAGKAAYEKVADLQAPAPAPIPEIARQVVQPQNVPIPSDANVPSLPAERALRLPADRLIFVPAPRPAPTAERELLPRSAAAPQPAAIEPLAVAPPPRVEPAREQPLSQAIEMSRTAADLPDAQEAPLPRREPPRAAAAALPADVSDRDLSAMPAPDAVPLARNLRGVTIANVELDPEGLKLSNSPLPVEGPAEPAAVMLDRAAVPSLAPAEREREPTLPPASATARVARPEFDSVRPLPEPAKSDDRTELSHSAMRSAPAAALAEEKPPAMAAVELAGEQPVEATAVELAPTMPAPLEISDPLSREAGGPRRPREPKLIVGALADMAVDAPLSTSPLATQLDRPRATAAPVAYAEDNIGMQAMFSLRQGDTRREFIDLVGGNEQTEAAVRRGLQWLAQHQHADGHWSLHQLDPPEKGLPVTPGAGSVQSDTAATGLALLPFLGSGHTHLEGEYQAVVAQAVGWLVERQKPNGDLFADSPSNARMYSHGIAAIALCESYGLSQDAKLRDAAQRAIDFIVSAQHADGGWRYQPGEPGDMSVVGWQVMALKSGEMAGLNVPQPALDAAGRWLASAAGSGGALGTFGYQGPGGSPAMSAEGLLCRQFLGSRRNDPQLKAGAEYLLKNLPQPGSETSYYWYYATQVMYHMQGDYWTAWNERLRDLLVSSQLKDGPAAGTWDPRDPWEQQGGRLYATSLRILMLEVYYRHLPLYGALE